MVSKATTPRRAPPSLLGVVGEEWAWLVASEENSCPFLPFFPPSEATGHEAERSSTCEPLYLPRVAGAPQWAAWWGVATGTLRVWGGASSLVRHRHCALRPGIPPLRPEDASWRAARLREGAAQCHTRFTHDSRAVIRVHRPQKAPRSNKGFGNEGQNTGGRVGALVKHPYRIQGKKPGWHRRSR